MQCKRIEEMLFVFKTMLNTDIGMTQIPYENRGRHKVHAYWITVFVCKIIKRNYSDVFLAQMF